MTDKKDKKERRYVELLSPEVISGYAQITQPDEYGKFTLVVYTNDQEFIDKVEKEHKANLEFHKDSGFADKYGAFRPLGEVLPEGVDKTFRKLKLSSKHMPDTFDASGMPADIKPFLANGSKIRIKILMGSYTFPAQKAAGSSMYIQEIQVLHNNVKDVKLAGGGTVSLKADVLDENLF